MREATVFIFLSGTYTDQTKVAFSTPCLAHFLTWIYTLPTPCWLRWPGLLEWQTLCETLLGQAQKSGGEAHVRIESSDTACYRQTPCLVNA